MIFQNGFYFFGILIFTLILGILLGELFSLKKIKKARRDAVKRSRAAISGMMCEQFAPFFPNFPCNPADAHFIGKPVDFVAFSGASKNNEVSEIIFIEVKSSAQKNANLKNRLTAREKSVKSAIENKKVRYAIYEI